MIDHVWTVVCSLPIVDKRLNNISLLNVIEKFTIAGEPAPDGIIGQEVHIATMWIRSQDSVPATGKSRIHLVTPSGKEILDLAERDIDLGNRQRLRQILTLYGIPAGEAGRHEFQVDLQIDGESEWRQVAVVPIEIVFESPEEVAGEKD